MSQPSPPSSSTMNAGFASVSPAGIPPKPVLIRSTMKIRTTAIPTT